MKPKLIIVYLLIVTVPLALLGGLGLRMARDEQTMMRQRLHELRAEQLRDSGGTIQRAMAEHERALQRALEFTDFETSRLRELARSHPLLRHVFVLDPKGRRLHPPPAGPVTPSEQEFLERAGQVWKEQQMFYRTGEGASNHGWHAWFSDNGFNLIYWRCDGTGHILGAEVDRVRLMADIVAVLPERSTVKGRTALTEATGSILYQWGDYPPSPSESPLTSFTLPAPLNTWRLNYYAPETRFGRRIIWTLVTGLIAVGLALTGLAVYFYRESTRELRDAAQRVSFVNQVSHELKTPLTNIRMYAELLEDSLPEPNRHVRVIVAESQRLSRLIANILRFARPHKLHKTTGAVDGVIRSVIEDFNPALAAKGIEVHFTGNASAPISFDADALEQIIGNLLGNIEKYAADGKHAEITTEQSANTTLITVTDRGPGIPADQRENIFKPFHRLSNKLTDGVTGTGIGLTIARDLARQHGGDLTLLPSTTGAAFQLRLPS
ncbi:MAG: HAMP domain-containing histidine kinase [Verrucomicrobia bacterium]|nr:HAMP domain-containing histidine kinase [Verrucomicrobiota bacterium]